MSNLYRLRIERAGRHSAYIVRRANGKIRCLDEADSRITMWDTALSFILNNSAPEIRFALEDAPDGEAAALLLRSLIKFRWKANMGEPPTIAVLTGLSGAVPLAEIVNLNG